MTVMQPPDQLEELEHVEEILLEELERVDEILLLLLRIVAAIDELPERIASANRREFGSVSGNGTRASEPGRGRASTRPFDPYGEDEAEELSGDKDVGVEAAEDKESAARQVARKVQSWVAADAPDRRALRFATLSLVVACLATAMTVVALIVAVFY